MAGGVGSLVWNENSIPTNLRNLYHVGEAGGTVVEKREAGASPIIRARESITRESGAMSWKLKCEATNGKKTTVFDFGVVSAEYTGTSWEHPNVWLLTGDGKLWRTETGALYVNLNNEDTKNFSYQFKTGDVVELTFDPTSQQLTATVEGKAGWSTTRRLEGSGVGEVHPCVCIASVQRVVALSRRGTSKQELEAEREHQNRVQQMPTNIDRMFGMLSTVVQEIASMRLEQRELRECVRVVQDGIAHVQQQATDTRTEVERLKVEVEHKLASHTTALEELQRVQTATQAEVAAVKYDVQQKLGAQTSTLEQLKVDVAAVKRDINQTTDVIQLRNNLEEKMNTQQMNTRHIIETQLHHHMSALEDQQFSTQQMMDATNSRLDHGLASVIHTVQRHMDGKMYSLTEQLTAIQRTAQAKVTAPRKYRHT